jgi:FtsZ-interacting cell division protein ZipA
MNDIVLVAIIGGIITLITGLVASIPGILALREQKKTMVADANKKKAEGLKAEADASKVFQDMAVEWAEKYRTRIAELEKIVKEKNTELSERIEKLEAELQEVAECAHALYNQIKKNGGTPECEPPTKKNNKDNRRES